MRHTLLIAALLIGLGSTGLKIGPLHTSKDSLGISEKITPTQSTAASNPPEVSAHEPALPAEVFNPTFPQQPLAKVLHVVTGSVAEVQLAIDTAASHCGRTGYVISVKPNILWQNPTDAGRAAIVEPPNNCTDGAWIVVQSDKLSLLPFQGNRVNPSMTSNMPQISTMNTGPVLSVEGSYYWNAGLEIEQDPSNVFPETYFLVFVGAANRRDSGAATSLRADHVVFDRCYIHGIPGLSIKQLVLLAPAGYFSVTDSYLAEGHVNNTIGAEANAIGFLGGKGPINMQNNYFESSTENTIFGGSWCGSYAPGCSIPTDITVMHNHFNKPYYWCGSDPLNCPDGKADADYVGIHYVEKNNQEWKIGRRILNEGNVHEGSWPDSQAGQSILITPRSSQSGVNGVVDDITYKNEIIRNVFSGFNLACNDNNDHNISPSLSQGHRIRIDNVLMDRIWGNNNAFGGESVFVDSSCQYLTISHVTAISGPHQDRAVTFMGFTNGGRAGCEPFNHIAGFTVIDSIFTYDLSGVGGDCEYGNPLGALDMYAAPSGGPRTWTWKNVVQVDPAGNHSRQRQMPCSLSDCYPKSWLAVGVIDPSIDHPNYQLGRSSAYHGAGTNGRDIGVDFESLQRDTRGVVQLWKIVSISPSNGAEAGGTKITIRGKWFGTDVSGHPPDVRVGEAPCSNVVVENSYRLTCTTTVHGRGSSDVVVANPASGGSAVLQNGFFYR